MTEDHRSCLVCNAEITSVHLGMDVCRACASFFKRAKTTGVEYPCRQGTRQCSVHIANKFTCKRCRFQKCLLVGMVYDGPLRLRMKPVIPLLERISREFKLMIERRRVRELEYVVQCKNRILVPHPKQKIYMVPSDCSFEFLDISISETWSFFENAFTTLNDLSKQERELLFKQYMIKLGLVISYYLTTKYFGNIRNKVMSSICTCYDKDVSIDFFYPGNQANKEILESSVRSHTDEHLSLFMPQINRYQMTEKEFHALAGMVFTDHDSVISEKAEQIIDDIRQELFLNLHSYYRNELGLIDYSVRLGQLMSLNHTYQECQSQHKVLIRYYTTFFDTYMTEQYMKVVSLFVND